ncbi:MAG: formate/nitrite transporter family protein [Candidatus Methanoplasma sp.]|jgi:formate/nitrite transporter FocA (FNT family)|nr:formate/nitrite transporter family protein [Candidatus Methanoplasma sp.]
MDFIKIIVSSILGGVMISIGGMACLLSEFRFIGALIFAVGLFGVMTYKMGLYTGKVGYILENPPIFFTDVLLTIVGNFIGCLLMGLAFPLDQAVASCDARLAADHLTVLFKGICCGLLVFIAVDQYKTKKNYIALFICIPAFIIAGFEHSIADMFFFSSAGMFNMDSLIFILTVILGNGIGCLAIPAYKKYIEKEEPAPQA